MATWNVWGRHGPWQERWPAIVHALRTLDPDVIALQETWRDAEHSQAQLLAEELGHSYWATEDVDQVGGIAIVSRLPLIAPRRLDLPYSGREFWPGAALVAGVETGFGIFDLACAVEWGNIFRVLGASADSSSRLLSYRTIVDALVARNRDVPPMLLGDLNASPDSEDIRTLTGKVPEKGVGLVFNDAWELLHGVEGGWTFDLQDNPWLEEPPGGRFRIDYVLPSLHPDFSCSWRIRRAERFGVGAHNGFVASDHYGVFAELELDERF